MRFAVLGTGGVGQAIGAKLVALGHEVTMGARQEGNANAVAWAQAQGPQARQGTFARAAEAGEVVVNCTSGEHCLEALESAGAQNLAGKVLIDVANPLDFSAGFPPSLAVCNTDSLGEQIQRAFPEARVVKALNTMSSEVMVDPALVPGRHQVFVCGDDADAKRQAAALLAEFGWPEDAIVDLGGIEAARGTEMYVSFWLRLYGVLGTGRFNVAVAR